MKFFTKVFKPVLFFSLATISFFWPSEGIANLSGHWIQHPAAALRTSYAPSQVDRIIDGEKYVYFSVRGSSFGRNQTYLYTTEYNIEPLTLFRYDKNEPWQEGCIKAVSQEAGLQGGFHSILNYSPELGVLGVIYQNGKVDFISDNGDVMGVNLLNTVAVPSNPIEAFSITFDPEKGSAYIATSNGVAVVEVATGEILDFLNLGTPVSWASRIGDNMVVFAGTVSTRTYSTNTYVFPVGTHPASLGTAVAGGANLQQLMPLSDNLFAALAPGANDTQYMVRLFHLTRNGTEYSDLTPVLTVDDGSSVNYRHLFRTDGFVSPTKEGYAISSNSSFHLLKKGVDADLSSTTGLDSYKKEAVREISKAELTDSEKKSKSATADGSEIWFYTYQTSGIDGSQRGFYSRKLTDGVWEQPGVTVAPNAPSSSFLLYADWHPYYGMLFRGPGSSFWHAGSEWDNLCSYSNGKWTDLSAVANAPSLNTPTQSARFIGIDPLNPDWVWANANKAGLFRTDLSNPKAFFELGTDVRKNQGWETAYPGYYGIFANQSEYNYLISLSPVDFDNEGRMWFSRFRITPDHIYDFEDLTMAYVPLYYYTAEERLAMLSDGAGERPSAPHEIRVPLSCGEQNTHLVALKSQGNENIIAFTPLHYVSRDLCPFLYDHNGTPDDMSDDRSVYIKGLHDEEGRLMIYNHYEWIYEDEDTGELWVCTEMGPMIVDPRELLSGGKTCRRVHINRKFGQPADDYPLEMMAVQDIKKDLLGRKWIATEQGLFVLSSDGNELLGFYDSDNSPLPSNNVKGVGCDGTTGAIFALTDRGMVEFHPEGSTAASGQMNESLSIWPSSLTPAYNGYINISGAVNNQDYVVTDAKGQEIVSLGKTLNGSLQWDGRDSDGKKVAPGRYNVKRRGTTETNILVVL